MQTPLSDLRIDYGKFQLDECSVPPSPFDLFNTWMANAHESIPTDANAFSLATVDKNGKPHSRIVLLKDILDQKFVFYTNYTSHKGQNIEYNTNVCMLFYWKELERQIRIEGRISKTTTDVSDQYFLSRPPESQYSAIASPQSQIISNRKELENKVASIKQQYQNEKIFRPDYWGGYQITPKSFEFWQGRSNRLHDRLKYIQQENNWQLIRLAP